MQPISFTPSHYLIDGRPAILYSGEFHYFRVPKADWRRRMQLFKEAGGNCIATYIPWLIHEPAEGDFRFGGQDGVLDLEGFLETAREAGLYVIARPGPYQYSELKYDGLPGWLCENYPQLRAHGLDGRPFRTSSISYLHPLFLDKARTWFARVCPIIARHTATRGGPVAFAQLDNEMTGIHVWFGSLDYNAEAMGIGQADGRFTRFLRERYGQVGALNRAWRTRCAAFEDARPIAPAEANTPAKVRRAKDYFDFYLGTVAEYAGILTGWMREHGIDVPIVHNSANPGMNPCFLETARALGGQFLLGSDHYYNLDQSWPQNNPTPQYAVNAFVSLEELRLMGRPPTVYEMPSGSASDWPPITAQDAKACYLANVALGAKGSNFYIYTGGPNPPGAGVTTDLYDYGAPIGAHGEIRPLYHAQKEVGLFLAGDPGLAEARREFDCRIGLDLEQARAGQYWTGRGVAAFDSPAAWDFLRRGALTTALCASLSPACVDLASDDWVADAGGPLSTPLIVAAASAMPADKQHRIVEFLRRGGKALIAPVLPTLDEALRPCTILADFLGAPAIARNDHQYSRITIGPVENIYNNGDTYLTAEPPAGAQVLGRDELTGQPAAWQVGTPGGGQAVWLGLRWSQAKREHERMLRHLLKRLGLLQRVVCSNPNVWTSLRTAGKRSWLYLMNLASSPMEAHAWVFPTWHFTYFDVGPHQLPPMTVRVVEVTQSVIREIL
jgi:beta-galactosidase